ncbi:hypothetical protein FBD94_01040 [Pedobacter hiemivivus]|uniref:Uncharacterized protein n=1 Tax=Pedobacter hiemivivus TaxID=2530454 RepID=A0A4U1GMD5_9SPHI|nr:hypothetical protein [Pedobacter hiemivivus]TKC65174.1 hypothetical protein FBD94_01040 [Pedobacter hiemivivus]
MNNATDLSRRLLKSYPVKILKEHFETAPGNQEEILEEILQNNSRIEIENFSYSHFNYTKQHIYIYKFQHPYAPTSITQQQLGYKIIKQDVTANRLLIFALADVTFQVIVNFGGAINQVDLNFHQPMMIEVTRHYLIIRFTVLESKLTPYFPANAALYSPTKAVDEKSILTPLIALFANNAPEKADLNKGIKKLWDDDSIDSREVKFKKSKSMSKETMDEDNLVKVEYPDVYAELMKSPLNKTLFKYLKDNDDLCGHFTCDPTNGEITIPLYSKNTSQIDSVINEIITNN